MLFHGSRVLHLLGNSAPRMVSHARHVMLNYPIDYISESALVRDSGGVPGEEVNWSLLYVHVHGLYMVHKLGVCPLLVAPWIGNIPYPSRSLLGG